MRSGREPTKPPSHDNISISISVNLRKQGEAKKQLVGIEHHLLQKDQPTLKRTLQADTIKTAKSKQVQEPSKQLAGTGTRIPRSARTLSEAPETVRMKTGQGVGTKTKRSKLLTQQTRRKPEPRKKSLSNDPMKRRKNSTFANKSVENLNRPCYNKSLSRTPLKSSKSKSKERQSLSESSDRKLKPRRVKLEIEDKYINTFENDPRKMPQSHRLPLEEMEHLASRYKKEARVKHSTSIEPKAAVNKKKGHRKNPTLEQKIKKGSKNKQKESMNHSRSKERNRSKSAKTSFIAFKEQTKPIRKVEPNIRINVRSSVLKVQSAIRAFLARRQIEEWKKQDQPQKAQTSADEVRLTEPQPNIFQLMHESQSSENSLKTGEYPEYLGLPESTQLMRMIQGLSRHSKGHPLQKQLNKIAEEAKKREQQHQQILRENEELRAMIETNRFRQSNSQSIEHETQRQKELQSLRNFKQEFGTRFSKLSGKKMEIDIEKIEADNEQRQQKLEQSKQKEKSPSITPVSIPGVDSPRSLMSLLREKERILSDKHNKEVEVLSIMLQKQLVSPKTYKTKLSALDRIIEEERTGLERSKQEAQRLAKLIRTIRSDKEQINRLDNVCKQELWSDAKEFVRELAAPPQATKSLYETEQAHPSPPIDRTRVDKIFNSFDAELQGGSAKSLPSNDHIQIINMEEEYHREQQTVQSEHVETEPSSSVVMLLPPFKTDIYFIKEYCTSLCQHILEDTYLRVVFLANVQTPLRYNQLDMLQWYRTNIRRQPTRCYNMFKEELAYPYFKAESQQLLARAISKQMFAQFNASFEELRLNEPDCNHTTVELELVFLEAILAALNESFNFERPCAEKGEPELWLPTYLRPRHHGLNTIDEEEYLIMCARAINRLIDWSTYYCGTMTEHVTYEKAKISEEQQQKIRETRLTLMMQRTVQQMERMLLDCEEATTQVKLQLAEELTDLLLREFISERPK